MIKICNSNRCALSCRLRSAGWDTSKTIAWSSISSHDCHAMPPWGLQRTGLLEVLWHVLVARPELGATQSMWKTRETSWNFPMKRRNMKKLHRTTCIDQGTPRDAKGRVTCACDLQKFADDIDVAWRQRSRSIFWSLVVSVLKCNPDLGSTTSQP